MDLSILDLAGQYGLPGILVGVLGWLIWKIGTRMLASIDNMAARWTDASNRIIDRLDEHERATVEAIRELAGRHERLEGKLDATLDWQDRTPTPGLRPTPSVAGSRPTPVMRHPPRRLPTSNDDK